MRPSLPADVLARAHQHARATIRQARPFLIAGLILTGAGLALELTSSQRLGTVFAGGSVLLIATVARYRSFLVLRTTRHTTEERLRQLGVPKKVMSDIGDPSLLTPSVARETFELLERMRSEGQVKKFRPLTRDEKIELRAPLMSFALVLLIGALLLLILSYSAAPSMFLIAGIVLVTGILRTMWNRTAKNRSTTIRVVLYPNNSNPGVEWAEYLGKSDEVWTINGEPAEWRKR